MTRKALRAVIFLCVALSCAVPVRAQDTLSASAPAEKHSRKRPVPAANAVQKKQRIPSIIQSELDRSRTEDKQTRPAVTAAAERSQTDLRQASADASSPLWPVFVSVLVAACATGAIVYFLFLRKRTPAPAASAPLQRVMPSRPVASPAADEDASAQPGIYDRVSADTERASVFQHGNGHGGFDDAEEDRVSSASPYVTDDESEMPEAALTMNLINKKRELKKELIQEVMRRVARKEKPQQIAEALRVGIGEVQLAITLAKLKK